MTSLQRLTEERGERVGGGRGEEIHLKKGKWEMEYWMVEEKMVKNANGAKKEEMRCNGRG